MKTSILTWSVYLKLIDKLTKKINWKKEKFDWIVAINRGGNIPAVILSHYSNVPLYVLNYNDIIDLEGKILIVDDISDTGTTLHNIGVRPGKNFDWKVATLDIRKGTKILPDYYVRTVNTWIKYPYEKE